MKYFYVALPMDFQDFFVAFSSIIGVIGLELIAIGWAVTCLVVAKMVTKNIVPLKAVTPQFSPSESAIQAGIHPKNPEKN